MAENDKQMDPLLARDGRFPPGADSLRAQYIIRIRQMTDGIRHFRPYTRGDLAHLETQYATLDNLHTGFIKAHAELMSKLKNRQFEKQETEMFNMMCQDITGALTILHRAIKTRKLADHTIPKPEEEDSSVQEKPKNKMEELIAANAILKHRLESEHETQPTATTSGNRNVHSVAQSSSLFDANQPSTSWGTTHSRSSPSERILKAKTNAHGMKANKSNDLRKKLQHKLQSVAVKPKAAAPKPKKEVVCDFCFSDHKIFRCEEFKRLTVNERFENVERMRLCPICLLHKESNHRCSRIHTECSMCAPLWHNTLLCPKRYGPNAPCGIGNSV